MKEVIGEASECRLPTYIEDILIHNYCPNFLRMTMVREDNDYTFSYQTERFMKLDVERLSTCDKLILLRTIIVLREGNEDWLIHAENYLLDPDLIYTLNNNVGEGCVRILFYPDIKRSTFQKKLIQFADKIKNARNKIESDLIDNFKSVCEMNDWNRIRMFLDKNILRMQNL